MSEEGFLQKKEKLLLDFITVTRKIEEAALKTNLEQLEALLRKRSTIIEEIDALDRQAQDKKVEESKTTLRELFQKALDEDKKASTALSTAKEKLFQKWKDLDERKNISSNYRQKGETKGVFFDKRE
jgi:integrase